MIGAKSFMGFDSCFNLNAYTVFISNALIVCLHLRLHILLNTAINSPNIFVTIPSEITFFFRYIRYFRWILPFSRPIAAIAIAHNR